MRLSDAGLPQHQTKALYPNHRLPPWLTEGAPRDPSNRLLGIAIARDYILARRDDIGSRFRFVLRDALIFARQRIWIPVRSGTSRREVIRF